MEGGREGRRREGGRERLRLNVLSLIRMMYDEGIQWAGCMLLVFLVSTIVI